MLIEHITLITNLLVIILLIIISVIDLKKLYIPNFLTVALIIIGLIYNQFIKDNLLNSFLGMGVYSIPFSLIYGYVSDLLDKEVLGYGDIKLAMGVGAYLGFTNFQNMYLFFLISYITASVYCVYILLKNRGSKKQNIQIPFAPFISISGCIMILVGG